MTTVQINDLWKTWGDFSAIRGANLTINDGEFLTLLGESGCGKTTTLRCIAGLETPTQGKISFGDVPVFDADRKLNAPPEHRRLGMVFQSYALWPHLTVRENVEFPLRSQKLKKDEIRQKSMSALDLVGLSHLADRSATALSGGQQQRVAVARALVSRPAVMLYDEPLSNLDPSLRRSMRDSIIQIHRLGGTTSVYVTHDLEEAMHLSDRVVVMQHGLMEQVDTPERIYTHPQTSYVASFVGFENVLDVSVQSNNEFTASVQIPCLDIELDIELPTGFETGTPYQLAVRGLHMHLTQVDATSSSSGTQGTITEISYLGAKTEYVVQIHGTQLKAALSEKEAMVQGRLLAVGSQVLVQLDPAMCRLVRLSAVPQTALPQESEWQAATRKQSSAQSAGSVESGKVPV